MCRVMLDLSKDRNLKFSVYNLILTNQEEFNADDLIQALESCQPFTDQETLKEKVENWLQHWVDEGIIQQHWNTFSLI